MTTIMEAHEAGTLTDYEIDAIRDDGMEALESGWLDGVTLQTRKHRHEMPPDIAAAIGNRVMLHLHRGNIAYARAALEDGWRSHLKEQEPPPNGKALLDEPMAKMIRDVRILNRLEQVGIVTVGQFLAVPADELAEMDGVGAKQAMLFERLRKKLSVRAGLAKKPR